MTNYNLRKLPAGIQSFKKIREENYLYVDKTDIIWNSIINGYKYNFFIRPRRFGKSLLVDTLQSYFEGKKELFEGLKIMSLEKEWKSYPVVRLYSKKAFVNNKQYRYSAFIRRPNDYCLVTATNCPQGGQFCAIA